MNSKLLMIIGAVVLLLGGGGIFFMHSNKMGPFADAVPEAPLPLGVEAPPRIVAMDVLQVPVITGDNVTAIIQIQLELQAKTAEAEGKLHTLLPRLNSAFLSDMHTFIPRLMKDQTRLEPTIVAQRLKLIGDRTIGEGVLSGVEVKQIADSSRRPERPAAPAP